MTSVVTALPPVTTLLTALATPLTNFPVSWPIFTIGAGPIPVTAAAARDADARIPVTITDVIIVLCGLVDFIESNGTGWAISEGSMGGVDVAGSSVTCPSKFRALWSC